MKIAVVMPVDKVKPAGEFLGYDALKFTAKAAEDAGFHSVVVTDHPSPTGRWLDHGGHAAQDPFVMLSFMAAATSRIQLQTGILVVPYRNPFIVARAVASLEAISNGRTILGVGAGYLKGEYFAVGADFERRNDVVDEYIRAMRAALGQDEFDFEGTGYNARGIRILPRPAQVPPIWVGGNSRRAIRRAAELGDAWSPFNTGALVAGTARTATMQDSGELAEGLAYLRAHADKIGKPPPKDIVLDSMKSPTEDWNAQALVDQIGAYGEMGVTWCSTHIPGETRGEWKDNLDRWSAEVLAKVA